MEALNSRGGPNFSGHNEQLTEPSCLSNIIKTVKACWECFSSKEESQSLLC